MALAQSIGSARSAAIMDLACYSSLEVTFSWLFFLDGPAAGTAWISVIFAALLSDDCGPRLPNPQARRPAVATSGLLISFAWRNRVMVGVCTARSCARRAQFHGRVQRNAFGLSSLIAFLAVPARCRSENGGSGFEAARGADHRRHGAGRRLSRRISARPRLYRARRSSGGRLRSIPRASIISTRTRIPAMCRSCCIMAT